MMDPTIGIQAKELKRIRIASKELTLAVYEFKIKKIKFSDH